MVIHIFSALREEADLSAKPKTRDAYKKYMKTTPFIVPSPGSVRRFLASESLFTRGELGSLRTVHTLFYVVAVINRFVP